MLANPSGSYTVNNLGLIHLRAFLRGWLCRAKRALQYLIIYLKQLREQLYRSYQEKQRAIERQIHEILVNLDDKQRQTLRRAIAHLEEILPIGTDRQIELALCEIANIITLDCRVSLGILRPRRGRYGRLAYGYLGENQEAVIWQLIAAYKKWFSTEEKAEKPEAATEVTEAIKVALRSSIADLDATLDAEQGEEIPGAIASVIERTGEMLHRWMPALFPSSFDDLDWDNWEASVWKAITHFKRRFVARSAENFVPCKIFERLQFNFL